MKKGSQVEREACSVCAARGWQENSPFVLSLEHRLSGGGGMTQELEGERRQRVVFMGWGGYVPTGGRPPPPQLLADPICKTLSRRRVLPTLLGQGSEAQ